MKSKLFNIKCDNCGAEYRINSRGEMNCPFCGSKIYLNDQDFKKYLKTRDEMLLKDKANNDMVNSDGDVLHKWTLENHEHFETTSGKIIDCKYYYKYSLPTQDIYVGSNRVTTIFEMDCADIIMSNIQRIRYPSADIKQLSKYMPEITFTAELIGYKYMVVINKPENVYPLTMFESLDPKQVAWMISRFENLGCLFEFSEVDFTGAVLENFYINPKTHEVYMLGGWETLCVSDTPKQYLTNIRSMARRVMNAASAPQMCMDFINNPPAISAYDDFKNWDNVIMNGFNGHNFHHFTETEW